MPFNYIEVLINIMLATFGGLVKRMTSLEKDPSRKVSLSYFIVGAFTSTFVGIVVYLVCKNYAVSELLTAGVTSVAGYIGSPVLDFISEVAKNRITKP